MKINKYDNLQHTITWLVNEYDATECVLRSL